MHIAMLGPMHTADFAPLLAERDVPALGYAGAPFLATLASALLDQGCRLTLVTTDKDADLVAPRVLRGKVDFVVCPARRYGTRPNGWRPGKAFDFFSAERRHMREAVLDSGADVVHAHWVYEFALAAIDAGRPTLITVHDSPVDVLRADRTVYNTLRCLMARRSLRVGRSLAAVSPFIQERLRESFGVSPSFILPNPLPLERIAAIRSRVPKSMQPTLLFVSNYWCKLKNPDVVFAAFAELRRAHPELRLHCIGRDFGPTGPAHRWAMSRELAGGVEFFGAQPHERTLELIRAGTILLHTSAVESFGMAVAEAMALGTPVVVDEAAGALPWLVEHGRAGYLARTSSVEVLKRVISAMLADPDNVRTVAAAGELRAATLCSAQAVATQTVAAYQLVRRA